MKTAFIVLISVLVVFGLANNFLLHRLEARPAEEWVFKMVPTDVTDFKVQADKPGSRVSYRMDDVVYRELDPIGVSCQRFVASGSRGFDAVIVVGNEVKSFHDQRWCFTAQGWTIKKEEDATIKTQSYGEIPVKLVEITRDQVQPIYAVFTFRGPTKFHSDIPSLSKDYFFYELFKMKKFVGSEYRVIPMWTSATKEDVLKFTADFIDATKKTSDGKI